MMDAGSEQRIDPEPAADGPAEPETAPIEAVSEAAPADPSEEAAPAEVGLALYVVRHADAGDPTTWAGDDADRPLSKKGRRQAKRLGRLLKGVDAWPDAVITSPRLRAVETARIIGRPIGVKPSKDDRLGLDFDDEALASLVAGLGTEVRSVMIVGHDPDFSRAVSWLVGSPITMRKGALALIDLPDRTVGAGRGSLRWLLPPDAIPD